jgi:hypothetical protein
MRRLRHKVSLECCCVFQFFVHAITTVTHRTSIFFKNPTTKRLLEESIMNEKLTTMKPTRTPTAIQSTRAEPTVKPSSLKPTKQSLSASTPPPNRAMCLLDAAIGTNVTYGNGCSSSAPYCVTGLIGPTCSVCAVIENGTSVGCTNEGETCGAPSCVRDLPLSCKVNHEASCPSKRPTSLTPTSRKPTSRKPKTKRPTTRKPKTKRPTTRKPTTMKPTSMKPTTM